MESINIERYQSIQTLGLRIQMAATAVATSFVLIFVPNVETITFMAFFLGYMFSLPFAMTTILTMVISWEVLATMVFSFSGITFPFKIIAWLIIGLLGNFARKIKARYFYEFMIFGLLSALIYDILTTISISLLFLNSKEAFFAVLLSNFIVGILFTISHTVSNMFLFSFKPILYKSIIPLLESNYGYLLSVKNDLFKYLDTSKSTSISWDYVKISKKRVLGYFLTSMILIGMLTISTLYYLDTRPKAGDGEEIGTTYEIDYSSVKPTDTIEVGTISNRTVFQILQDIANVEYEEQSLGILVIAINNVWNDINLSDHFWIYYVNGEYQQFGANQNYLENGDYVLWKYQ